MKKRKKKKSESGPPRVRLPLPAKSAKRHGDRKKYDRKREKERLRAESAERGAR